MDHMATSAAVPQSANRTVPKRRFGGDEVAYACHADCSLHRFFVVTVLLVWQLWIHSAPAREKFGFGFLTSKTVEPGDRCSSARCRSSTER